MLVVSCSTSLCQKTLSLLSCSVRNHLAIVCCVIAGSPYHFISLVNKPAYGWQYQRPLSFDIHDYLTITTRRPAVIEVTYHTEVVEMTLQIGSIQCSLVFNMLYTEFARLWDTFCMGSLRTYAMTSLRWVFFWYAANNLCHNDCCKNPCAKNAILMKSHEISFSMWSNRCPGASAVQKPAMRCCAVLLSVPYSLTGEVKRFTRPNVAV